MAQFTHRELSGVGLVLFYSARQIEIPRDSLQDTHVNTLINQDLYFIE